MEHLDFFFFVLLFEILARMDVPQLTEDEMAEIKKEVSTLAHSPNGRRSIERSTDIEKAARFVIFCEWRERGTYPTRTPFLKTEYVNVLTLGTSVQPLHTNLCFNRRDFLKI